MGATAKNPRDQAILRTLHGCLSLLISNILTKCIVGTLTNGCQPTLGRINRNFLSFGKISLSRNSILKYWLSTTQNGFLLLAACLSVVLTMAEDKCLLNQSEKEIKKKYQDRWRDGQLPGLRELSPRSAHLHPLCYGTMAGSAVLHPPGEHADISVFTPPSLLLSCGSVCASPPMSQSVITLPSGDSVMVFEPNCMVIFLPASLPSELSLEMRGLAH